MDFPRTIGTEKLVSAWLIQLDGKHTLPAQLQTLILCWFKLKRASFAMDFN